MRQVFKIGRKGNIAGSIVRDGAMRRNAQARVIRNGEQLIDSRINSLKRFQEDAREVLQGFECGIGVEGFEEFQEGDVIETYRRELVTQA